MTIYLAQDHHPTISLLKSAHRHVNNAKLMTKKKKTRQPQSSVNINNHNDNSYHCELQCYLPFYLNAICLPIYLSVFFRCFRSVDLGAFDNTATNNCQYCSTVAISIFSSGEWGNLMVGPMDTMSH